MKKNNLFKSNRALDAILSFTHRVIRHCAMPGWRQREGRGPLPSIESDIHPFKKVKTEVVRLFEKW